MKNGYVYSLWSGRFRCEKATITNYSNDSRNAGLAIARFLNGGYLEVAQDPKEIHNAIVWFEERDDAAAIQILVDYQEQQILKLQEKIKNYQHKIKILHDGVEGGLNDQTSLL